jgi:hypothetical protein
MFLCKKPQVSSNMRTIKDPSVIVPIIPSPAELEKALAIAKRRNSPAKKVIPYEVTLERVVDSDVTNRDPKNGIWKKAANFKKAPKAKRNGKDDKRLPKFKPQKTLEVEEEK